MKILYGILVIFIISCSNEKNIDQQISNENIIDYINNNKNEVIINSIDLKKVEEFILINENAINEIQSDKLKLIYLILSNYIGNNNVDYKIDNIYNKAKNDQLDTIKFKMNIIHKILDNNYIYSKYAYLNKSVNIQMVRQDNFRIEILGKWIKESLSYGEYDTDDIIFDENNFTYNVNTRFKTDDNRIKYMKGHYVFKGNKLILKVNHTYIHDDGIYLSTYNNNDGFISSNEIEDDNEYEITLPIVSFEKYQNEDKVITKLIILQPTITIYYKIEKKQI